jgi:glycosyltransferase involved in cell wall biosynthesis
MNKKISILTACYNEEDNIEILYNKVKHEMSKLQAYNYEHIFIDNCSNDKTLNILKKLSINDKNLKIIVNAKNYGHIKSPFHGLLQCQGDAIISIVADLQDPPDLILQFIKKWEEGYKIVVGTKTKSEENRIMFFIRKLFYNLIKKMSEVTQIKNFTGFGLYDKSFIEILKKLDEPYPYFRGLVSELGYDIAEVIYTQPNRHKGKTKNNFYTLYDMAMLGFVSYSKIPLRLASFIGFFVSLLSFLVAILYFFYKLMNWSAFQLGLAPLVIGIFFLGGIQLFFLGVIGEYISAIFTQVKKRPLVIEKERINF